MILDWGGLELGEGTADGDAEGEGLGEATTDGVGDGDGMGVGLAVGVGLGEAAIEIVLAFKTGFVSLLFTELGRLGLEYILPVQPDIKINKVKKRELLVFMEYCGIKKLRKDLM